MKKRARRRGDTYRMKLRAYRLLRYRWHYRGENWEITPTQIGRVASMHGTHQCKMCNFHKHDGTNARPHSELRKGVADEWNDQIS